MKKDIYPIFDVILSKNDKEKLLNQKSIVIWMLGLSGSGKSTLAKRLEHRLYQLGYLTQLLDGDNLRIGINSNLGFSESERAENIRRTAEIAKLFSESGIIVICSLITPLEKWRKMARNIIGKSYFEVFVDCPIEVCEKRDVKGLYKKARKGDITGFTGIDAPFEDPEYPDLTIQTAEKSQKDCEDQLLEVILPKIKYKNL